LRAGGILKTVPTLRRLVEWRADRNTTPKRTKDCGGNGVGWRRRWGGLVCRQTTMSALNVARCRCCGRNPRSGLRAALPVACIFPAAVPAQFRNRFELARAAIGGRDVPSSMEACLVAKIAKRLVLREHGHVHRLQKQSLDVGGAFCVFRADAWPGRASNAAFRDARSACL